MSSPITKPVQPHIQRLDVLRALAIIFVVLFHFYGSVRYICPDLSPADGARWESVFDWGTSGVPLFFVISGFCIHLSCLRSGRFSTADFYWRRFARIYPAYGFSLLVFTILAGFKIIGTVNFKQVILHVFLIHNFFPQTIFHGINAPYWSLAVEMQFYLLYPLLLICRQKFGLKTCLGIIFLISLGYDALCLKYPAISATVSNPTVVPSWYGWILGACVAEGYAAGKNFFPWKGWAVAITLGALIICSSVQALSILKEPALFLFLGALLQNYLAWTGPLYLIERALVPIGLVSYSIYLWHMPLLKVFERGLFAIFHVPKMFFWQFAFYFPMICLCLAPLAFASYVLLELKATEWVRGKRPSRREKNGPRL